MRAKVTVAGSPEQGAAVADRLAGNADVSTVPEELSGSDVVVLGPGADVAGLAARARDRAPNAVLIVAGDGIETAFETTLFPRARIIGAGEEDVPGVVEAVVFDRRTEFRCVARCEGERGIEGAFELVPVTVGRDGIEAILET